MIKIELLKNHPSVVPALAHIWYKVLGKIWVPDVPVDGIVLFEAETLHAVPQAGIWRGSVWPKPNGQKTILSGLAALQDYICTSLCKYELGSGKDYPYRN